MNQEMQQDGSQLVPVRAGDAYPTVPLSKLVEFATQKSYTELQRLVDLLPMRTDLEKKVELLGFLYRSRMLFIRVLALVRWETSANKVEKCKRILQVLETQSGLLVQTADTLASLSRETLQRARLPAFYLPAAIDVLTLRNYPRLPTVIRDRLTRPVPLIARERHELVVSLNGLIQRRLLREALPLAMRTFEVRDGRVVLTVAREFSIEATLYEHAVRTDSQPTGEEVQALGCVWRLLKLRILVVDNDSQPCRRSTRSEVTSISKAGRSRPSWTSPLVHPMQVGYLLETAQRYIADKRQPLVALFECLHSFCISLQLEVLYTQTARLTQTISSPFLAQLQPSRDSLRVNFWADRVAVVVAIRYCQVATSSSSASDSGSMHSFSSLVVTHEPPLTDPVANIRIQNALANDDVLSIERVLILTMHTRVVERLKLLQRELRRLVNGACELRGCGQQDAEYGWLRPAMLCVPIVARCSGNEQLRVAVDIYTNEVRVACVALRANARAVHQLNDLERLLNTIDADCNKSQSQASSSSAIAETMKQVATILSELRLLIALARCESSLAIVNGAHPKFFAESELALRFGVQTAEAVRSLLDKRVTSRIAIRALVAMPHHDSAYIVVAPQVVAARKTVAFDFFLLHIGPPPTLMKVELGALCSTFIADRHLVSRAAPESIDEAHFEEQLSRLTAAVLSANPPARASTRTTSFANSSSFVPTQLARRLDRKRRLLLCFSDPSASKRARFPDSDNTDADAETDDDLESRMVPGLTSLLEFSSERLSFLLLCRELQKRGLCVDRVAFDSETGKCSISVLTFPQTDGVGGELDCRVVECAIRRAGASSGYILAMRIDIGDLLAPLAPLVEGPQPLSAVQKVHDLHEFVPTESGVQNTVKRIVSDWRSLARMFSLIRRFSIECQSDPERLAFLRSFIVLEKCTLRSIVFSYRSTGDVLRNPASSNQLGDLLCTIHCAPEAKANRGAYSIHFSRRHPMTPTPASAAERCANPHCLASSTLENLFNNTLSITELCVAMRTNLLVLKTLSLLDYRLSAGYISGRQSLLTTTFSLIVISPLDFVLTYKNTFNIEISLSAARPNCVMLRERNRDFRDSSQMPFDCLYLFKQFIAKLADSCNLDGDVEMSAPALPMPNLLRHNAATQLASSSSSASEPLTISVDAFSKLLMPVRFTTTSDASASAGFTYPLIEAYCGCALLFRQFQRTLTGTGDESSTVWRQCEVKPSPNECMIQLDFASDQVVGALILKITDDLTPTLSLRIPAPANRPADPSKTLAAEQSQVLERYFEMRIVPQLKPQAVITFVRLLGMSLRFLRDAIQLLRFELAPQGLLHPQTTGAARGSAPAHNLIAWCTCVPPGLSALPLPGSSALAYFTGQQQPPRIVSFWQFRRVVPPSLLNAIAPAELEQHYEQVAGFYVDRNALVLPLLYDIATNTLSVSRLTGGQAVTGGAGVLQRASAHLTRFLQNNPGLECPLYAAVIDLAMHFTI